MRASKRCVLALVLCGAGCSLGDFGYLSADFGRDAPAGGTAGVGGATAGGSTAAAAGAQPEGGMSGASGAAGSVAGGGSAGSGGSAPDHYFCDPKYAVFGKDSEPPVELPSDGDYVIRKYNAANPGFECLLTPGWPELGEQQYFAITQVCGGPGAPNPAAPEELWHFERLCSDVFRLTAGHDGAGERQLGVIDHSMVGTPLHSIPSERNVDPSFLFQLRFEELIPAGGPGAPPDQPLVRWRLSPLIQASSCVEQVSQGRYGELDVVRVVLFPCTGSMPNQSWNLLAVP